MTTTTAPVPVTGERIVSLRRRVEEIDERTAAIQGRLDDIPAEEEALRLAVARDEVSPSDAAQTVAVLRAQAERLEAELDGLGRDRDASTTVLGDLEAEEAEARALRAHEASAGVMARIEERHKRTGEHFAAIAAEWTAVMDDERELAALRAEVGNRPELQADMLSPSEPLPVDLKTYLNRLYEHCVAGDQFAAGRIGHLLPDLSGHGRRGTTPHVWVPGVARWERD